MYLSAGREGEEFTPAHYIVSSLLARNTASFTADRKAGEKELFPAFMFCNMVLSN